MPILAIECSGLSASVGIFDGDVPVVRARCGEGTGAAEDLAPRLKEVLASVEPAGPRQHAPVDWVAVTVGPGSFTGLRVGLATAKAMAYAWAIPLVAVDTLQAIAGTAAKSLATEDEIWIVPIINAFRKQVFSAVWSHRTGEPMRQLRETQVMDLESWGQGPDAAFGLEDEIQLRRCKPKILLTGPGLPLLQPMVESLALPGVEPAAEQFWNPSLEAVNGVARLHAERGDFRAAAELLPNYVRRSAAEEKAAAKA
ncbi:MAG: tRNA (adenosine(37)-N6)-threonylcarbamoyltransferase complex dimerization subunit type 1 TsaB [Aureliella sp.]